MAYGPGPAFPPQPPVPEGFGAFGGGVAGVNPAWLASSADRERAVGVLRAGFTEGRLTQDELDNRVARAYTARTYGQLWELTSDLPAGALPHPQFPHGQAVMVAPEAAPPSPWKAGRRADRHRADHLHPGRADHRGHHRAHPERGLSGVPAGQLDPVYPAHRDAAERNPRVSGDRARRLSSSPGAPASSTPSPSTTGWTNTASCSSPPRSATASPCSPLRPPRSSSVCCPPRPAGRPSSRGTNASPGDPDLLSPGTRTPRPETRRNFAGSQSGLS